MAGESLNKRNIKGLIFGGLEAKKTQKLLQGLGENQDLKSNLTRHFEKTNSNRTEKKIK